jgi:NTP pyrophosphatase (non-canonical NTP hydrolase)
MLDLSKAQTSEQADYFFVSRVIDEARRARLRFPAPNTTFAAATEELGEVAKALMDLQAGRDTRDHFVEECVQLAAMALRMAIEGDPTFPSSLNAYDLTDASSAR